LPLKKRRFAIARGGGEKNLLIVAEREIEELLKTLKR